MKVFDHPNLSSGWKCPVCGTDEDRPVILAVDIKANMDAGIDTAKDSNVIAEQIHLDCIDLCMVSLPDNQCGLMMTFRNRKS